MMQPTPATPNLYTSPSQAAKTYAAHFVAQSLFVDVSNFPLKLLHSRSNRYMASDAIELAFPSWAKSNSIRIDPDLYGNFLRNLPKRVMANMPCILGTSFRPCKEGHFVDHAGAPLANTFVPFCPDRPPAPTLAPAILEEYFDRLFESDADRKHTLQFMAHTIQQPMVRPQWGILCTGDHGTGKSTLTTLLKLALGNRHVYSHNDYTPAFAKFSEILPNNLCVAFDDADATKGTYEDLKLAITRTTMPVEIKNLQGNVEREVYARIMVFSNNLRPLLFPHEDRRLYVLQPITHKSTHNPQGCVLNTDAFFVRLKAWWESPEAPAILYHYFMDIDLTGFKPGSTIKTETHSIMAGLSSSVVDTLIEGFFVDRDGYRFHQNELLSYLRQNSVPFPNVDSLKLKLSKLSYEYKRRDVCGERLWVWQPIVLPRSPSFTQPEEVRIGESANITF